MAEEPMLKLGQGLRAVGRRSPTLIELSNNKGRFGLGYEPTHEEHFQAFRGKKRKCVASGMSIPYIKTTFGSGRGHYARTIQGIGRWKT